MWFPCRTGMGMWLAIFDNSGDLAGSISKRPKMEAMVKLLDEKGDEIFAGADSIVLEMDLDKEIIKRVFHYAEKYKLRVYAVVANMSIASQRRDFFQSIDCFVCNALEAGILFVADFEHMGPDELCLALSRRVVSARIPSMVVTMGSRGAVYADMNGGRGFCPAKNVAYGTPPAPGTLSARALLLALPMARAWPRLWKLAPGSPLRL